MTHTPPRAAWRQWLVPGLVIALAYLGLQWWQGRQADGVGQQLAAVARPGDILMYSTDTCVYCHRAMAQMDRWAVPYAVCDIDRNATCAQTYRQAGAPGTPLMKVKEQWQLGFSAEGVLAALQRQQGSEPQGR